MHVRLGLLMTAVVAAAGCEQDGVKGSDGVDASGQDGPTGPDADVGEDPCDMTGRWSAEQHTDSTALGANQHTTTWYFYEFAQTGDSFTATRSMNCGLIVDGTTTVTLDDNTQVIGGRRHAVGRDLQMSRRRAAEVAQLASR